MGERPLKFLAIGAYVAVIAGLAIWAGRDEEARMVRALAEMKRECGAAGRGVVMGDCVLPGLRAPIQEGDGR